jgi:hypothetical protein
MRHKENTATRTIHNGEVTPRQAEILQVGWWLLDIHKHNSNGTFSTSSKDSFYFECCYCVIKLLQILFLMHSKFVSNILWGDVQIPALNSLHDPAILYT